jgi:2-polyprenyl-6-methoxyphenol hydroxylase-like FAD-dependent oxidoreductase
MGDFSDNTSLGSDAAIFLCDEGLIESFPLLDQKRRWVVKTDKYLDDLQRQDIEERIAHRIGYDLSSTENKMLSSFGVQKMLAKPMVKNRIILAGDAAHIVSPIGGQGMNLGWLGAWDLSQSLRNVLNNKDSHSSILDQFERRRCKAARNAIRRAELNMRLGRKPYFPSLRNKIVSLMLNTPLSTLMARIFTMRGVERWIL